MPQQQIIFLPQRAYLPEGTFRNLITYPHDENKKVEIYKLVEILKKVNLHRLIERWNWTDQQK